VEQGAESIDAERDELLGGRRSQPGLVKLPVGGDVSGDLVVATVPS
jgi:hypothetical protein